MQEERFSLGENGNHIVTVMPFNTNLKVHIRQFYVNENGEIASRIGVTLSVEEFNELVKLIPKVHQDLAADESLYGPTTDKDTPVTEHDNPVSLPSLENIDDDSQKK